MEKASGLISTYQDQYKSLCTLLGADAVSFSDTKQCAEQIIQCIGKIESKFQQYVKEPQTLISSNEHASVDKGVITSVLKMEISHMTEVIDAQNKTLAKIRQHKKQISQIYSSLE